MYLNQLLAFASPIFPIRINDTCIASINTTDVSACNNVHDEAFLEIEEAFDRKIESCQLGFCTSLDYASSAGPMGMCSCGIVFCSNEAYRAPTKCDEGEEYLMSLAHLVKCTVDAAKEAFRQRKEIISVESNAQAKQGRDASQSCQDLVLCEEDVLQSVTKSWANRYCHNYLDLLLSAEISPNNEYAWIKQCGIDHPTVAPLIALCMDVFSSNVIDENEGLITYNDPDISEGPPIAQLEPSSATTFALAGVASLFFSPLAMLYI